MRTCPYCGKAYSDNLEFCPVDHRPLLDNRVRWDNLDAPKRGTGRFFVKAATAGIAYVPMVVFYMVARLHHVGVMSEATARPILFWCAIYNFPAASISELMQSFNLSALTLFVSLAVLMFMWSTFLAWFFWKVAGMFLGEEEPPATRGKYDWAGFQVRFVIGFIVGFFIGWRFVRDTKSMEVMFTACVVTGLLGGFLYGISRPPDFWSRS